MESANQDTRAAYWFQLAAYGAVAVVLAPLAIYALGAVFIGNGDYLERLLAQARDDWTGIPRSALLAWIVALFCLDEISRHIPHPDHPEN